MTLKISCCRRGLCLLALLVGMTPTAAHADLGAAVVSGGATPHHRSVVREAVQEALRGAGWSLLAMADKDAARIAACFANPRPAACLAPMVAARKLARVIAVQVERELGDGDGDGHGHAQVRLTGQLSEAEHVTLDVRYCDPCGDPQLAAAAHELALRLLAGGALRSADTRIEVRTTPPGAVIRLDGRMIDAPADSIIVSPGAHTIHLQLSGYRSEFRTLHVSAGSRERVEVALVALVPGVPEGPEGPEGPALATATDRAAPLDPGPGSSEQAGTGPSRLGWTLALSGGAAIVAGAALWALDEDPVRDATRVHTEQYFDSAPAGIGVAIAGALALSAGLYWLTDPSPAHPQLAVGRDGGMVGWVSGF